jgi:3-hydroxyacyl-CoA dehydrogenase/enoyl-CoA hydratase/3-hydroxybutyryl-CoA epimerase/3-hydroxyacyl-CoA dehydrogenase/enoyl-CoA hydratase/3-hydroxybutyryl-CoA epimerase/enoyl-CoA isomerase
MEQAHAASRTMPVRSVGILGAGTMGSGIAFVNARAGIPVKIFDIDTRAAVRVVERIRNDQQLPGVSNSPVPRHADCDRVSVATTESELAETDLIVEAVPEDEGLKRTILGRLKSWLDGRPEVIVASNSSSIPISRLASELGDPRRLCGLHFCHPVAERTLVEVVETTLASQETIDRAFEYVLRLGKAPLRVRDSPGFLLNRLLVPFFNAALELLLEGAEPEALDEEAEAFGMPAGPLRLLDEFGLDVALAVGRTMYLAFPDRIAPSELLIAMFKAGRLGRKSGAGFYSMDTGSTRPHLDHQTAELIRKRRRSVRKLSPDVISRRLLLPMLLEAARVCEERIIENPVLIDQALRNGLGMTERFQGLSVWINRIGAEEPDMATHLKRLRQVI